MLYPGVHALVLHRLAHRLWAAKFYFLGMAVSQFSRFLTGVEIHPGATIGRNLYLHHAMGIVIGETSEIGDNVMIFHGVTLGTAIVEKRKRHPTIGNGVTIGAGAQLIGPITIGDNAKIGAQAVVTRNVPQGATVAAPLAKIITVAAGDFAI